MGLDIDIYRLPKGTKIKSYEDLFAFDSYKYFRKNYSIHEVMCLSVIIDELQCKIDDAPHPISYYSGQGEYKISNEQYKIICEILKRSDINKLIADYEEKDNPKQLLDIFNDFEKYDFWYSWVN